MDSFMVKQAENYREEGMEASMDAGMDMTEKTGDAPFKQVAQSGPTGEEI